MCEEIIRYFIKGLNSQDLHILRQCCSNTAQLHTPETTYDLEDYFSMVKVFEQKYPYFTFFLREITQTDEKTFEAKLDLCPSGKDDETTSFDHYLVFQFNENGKIHQVIDITVDVMDEIEEHLRIMQETLENIEDERKQCLKRREEEERKKRSGHSSSANKLKKRRRNDYAYEFYDPKNRETRWRKNKPYHLPAAFCWSYATPRMLRENEMTAQFWKPLMRRRDCDCWNYKSTCCFCPCHEIKPTRDAPIVKKEQARQCQCKNNRKTFRQKWRHLIDDVDLCSTALM